MSLPVSLQEYDKQDCELKAAKRLLGRLKDEFGRLRLIILLDGLYLCEDILNICRANGWKLYRNCERKDTCILEGSRKDNERKVG